MEGTGYVSVEKYIKSRRGIGAHACESARIAELEAAIEALAEALHVRRLDLDEALERAALAT